MYIVAYPFFSSLIHGPRRSFAHSLIRSPSSSQPLPLQLRVRVCFYFALSRRSQHPLNLEVPRAERYPNGIHIDWFCY